MSIRLPEGYRWDDRLQLGRETAELTAALWPNYLIQNSDLAEPELKFEISREELARRFPVWGIRRESDGRLAAYANAVLLNVDLTNADLPEDGWRFAIRRAAAGGEPNCLCLVVANVDPEMRGLGFSQALIARAKLAAKDLRFTEMIAPVRPLLKHESPFTSMTAYIQKLGADGEVADPWIRMHIRSGGRVANVCSSSVEVRASIKKWREWTGLALEKSGEAVVPKGLVPLKVDAHRGVGVYREPNVWVRYHLT